MIGTRRHRKKYAREYVKEHVESQALDRELIWRLLQYLKPYAWILVATLLLLFVAKVIEASVPIFIGNISQNILNAFDASTAQKALVLEKTLHQGILVFVLLALSYAFDSGNVILRSWIGQNALYTFRMQIYEHVLKMPLRYFDHNTIGRLMTRTIHDVDQINQMFSECVIPILGNLLLFVCILIGILIIDWRLALIVIAVLPIVIFLTRRFRKFQRKCYDRLRTVVSAMNTFIQEHLMGASIIRHFGLHESSKKHFEEINEDYCQANIDSMHHFAFFMAAIDFLQSFSLIMVFAVLAVFTPIGQEFSAGTFFAFSLYAVMFFRPLADLAERYNVLQSAMAAGARIFNLLDSHSEASKDTGTLELESIESVSFQNVWFAYNDENWILKDFSLNLLKGESGALVGITGQGKSTIISLLLRFYEIQEGEIFINRIPIKRFSLESLRKQFSIVLQDPVLFTGTIAENISLFDPKIPISIIEETIDYLGMRAQIASFPQGIHHHLHERGKDLSAGQMQLISLARAVVHQRSMLILDEATANIDTVTEHVIQSALKKLLQNRSALVIAHRLSTIQDVDRIFVLQDGKIVEEGSHKDLLKAKGLYEKLCRLQFSK